MHLSKHRASRPVATGFKRRHISVSRCIMENSFIISMPVMSGFNFAGIVLHPQIDVKKKIFNKFEVNEHDADKLYNYCMQVFATDTEKYRKMSSETLLKTCFDIVDPYRRRRLHNEGIHDDDDLPHPPGRYFVPIHLQR